MHLVKYTYVNTKNVDLLYKNVNTTRHNLLETSKRHHSYVRTLSSQYENIAVNVLKTCREVDQQLQTIKKINMITHGKNINTSGNLDLTRQHKLINDKRYKKLVSNYNRLCRNIFKYNDSISDNVGKFIRTIEAIAELDKYYYEHGKAHMSRNFAASIANTIKANTLMHEGITNIFGKMKSKMGLFDIMNKSQRVFRINQSRFDPGILNFIASTREDIPSLLNDYRGLSFAIDAEVKNLERENRYLSSRRDDESVESRDRRRIFIDAKRRGSKTEMLKRAVSDKIVRRSRGIKESAKIIRQCIKQNNDELAQCVDVIIRTDVPQTSDQTKSMIAALKKKNLLSRNKILYAKIMSSLYTYLNKITHSEQVKELGMIRDIGVASARADRIQVDEEMEELRKLSSAINESNLYDNTEQGRQERFDSIKYEPIIESSNTPRRLSGKSDAVSKAQQAFNEIASPSYIINDDVLSKKTLSKNLGYNVVKK